MSQYRRAVRLNREKNNKAVKTANAKVPVANTPELRKKWMDAYIAAGGEYQVVKPKGRKPTDNTEKCRHCIQIILKNDAGESYARARYRVKLADKLIQEGTLDSNGSVLLQDGIQNENYTVEFPEFNPDTHSTKKKKKPTADAIKCGALSEKKLKCHELFQTLSLSPNKTHKIIVPPVKRELIVVVGTENWYNTYALKMMFFASAVRDIRLNADKYDIATLAYFNFAYNQAEIGAVKKSLNRIEQKSKRKIKRLVLANRNDLIGYLNKPGVKDPNSDRKVCRRTARVDIYAHGVPGEISFGYNTTNRMTQSLMKKNIILIKPERFTKDALLWSYACRTGMGPKVSSKKVFKNDAEALPDDSLAQAIADHLGIEVRAWLVKTNYGPIWDDKGDKKYRKGIVELDHKGIKEGGSSWDPRLWITFRDDEVRWHYDGAYGDPIGDKKPQGLSTSYRVFRKRK